MVSPSTTLVVYNENEIHVPSATVMSATFAKYDISVSEQQISQIQRYMACLVFWNQRVSLTSVTDPMEILERHFAESLLAAPLITQKEGRLADVGTGPGFPSLALKIALPNLQVLLIERNTKKCAFLNEVIRFLDLDQVSVLRSDYAEISPSLRKFDCIVARAVGDHKALLRWSVARLAPAGQLILWLGQQDAIKISQSKCCSWDQPIPIPNSQRRLILVGHQDP
ncbi:MAG TPA: 16S rRNA (guanine(527)-N(7))-methyltransferase RsmG [Candidatus Acidoferrum sp.]|nr:16S rRNA (guanine(527)-N(7))-methyltransferase RsmG [Candidatus Acidoferrum sp.]